jgi:hypothetical protein
LLVSRVTKVLLSTDENRISPLVDAAESLRLVMANSNSVYRQEGAIAAADPVSKVKPIVELGAGVLIGKRSRGGLNHLPTSESVTERHVSEGRRTGATPQSCQLQ